MKTSSKSNSLAYDQAQSEKKLDQESIILSSELRHWWVKKIIIPLEKILIHYQIKPNTITICSTCLSLVTLILFAKGKILFAGWWIFFQGSLDILDGRVARATNQVSEAGSFLDSVMDRYQDGLILFGIYLYYRNIPWLRNVTLIALIGTMLVPYVRAKAEILAIDLSKVGILQRPERIFLIGVCSVIGAIVKTSLKPFLGWQPNYGVIIAVIVLCVGTHWTALQRIQTTLKKLS